MAGDTQSCAKAMSHLSLAALLLALVGCGPPGGCTVSVITSSMGGYAFDFKGEKATRAEEGEMADGAVRIVVEHQFGKVAIRATEETFGWDWDLSCWADDTATAEAFTKQVTLEHSVLDGVCSWKLVLPKPADAKELNGVESNLTLSVPTGVHVELRNSFGKSAVEGVTGNTQAHCSHGDLTLSKLGGAVNADVGHGDLNAQSIAGGVLTGRHGDIEGSDARGALQVSAAHGSVNLQRIEGDVGVTNRHDGVLCTGISGKVTVDNQHGKVVVGQVDGPVQVNTSFAGIDVSGSSGNVRLRNRHGAIAVRDCTGEIDAQTAHGDIDIESPAPTIRCRNEHGGVRLVLNGQTFLNVEALTSHGDLDVSVPAGIEPKITATTEHGDVKSALPVGKRGPVQDGSDPRMSLQNSFGDIRIRTIQSK